MVSKRFLLERTWLNKVDSANNSRMPHMTNKPPASPAKPTEKEAPAVALGENKVRTFLNRHEAKHAGATTASLNAAAVATEAENAILRRAAERKRLDTLKDAVAHDNTHIRPGKNEITGRKIAPFTPQALSDISRPFPRDERFRGCSVGMFAKHVAPLDAVQRGVGFFVVR